MMTGNSNEVAETPSELKIQTLDYRGKSHAYSERALIQAVLLAVVAASVLEDFGMVFRPFERLQGVQTAFEEVWLGSVDPAAGVQVRPDSAIACRR
jgi:hypothetical protein